MVIAAPDTTFPRRAERAAVTLAFYPVVPHNDFSRIWESSACSTPPSHAD
jgi:hypothetical protein